ncbi:MAG: hypothetical protein V4601_07750, partial [Pseudomonadota bacterium]
MNLARRTRQVAGVQAGAGGIQIGAGVLGEQMQEKNFVMAAQAAGHAGMQQAINLGEDQVQATVNSQMLDLRWTRAG